MEDCGASCLIALGPGGRSGLARCFLAVLRRDLVKLVEDDGEEEVDHEKGAEEDEQHLPRVARVWHVCGTCVARGWHVGGTWVAVGSTCVTWMADE